MLMFSLNVKYFKQNKRYEETQIFSEKEKEEKVKKD